MTRKGTHAHTAPIRWTPEADEALESALIALSAGLGAKTDRWHAVCGRMAPEVITTPQAARSRWDRIVARRAKAAQQVEEANRLEEEIAAAALAKEEEEEQWREADEAYHQEPVIYPAPCGGIVPSRPPVDLVRLEATAERIEATLDRTDDATRRIEALLVKLAAVWGVAP